MLFNKSDLISTPLGKEMKIGLSSLVWIKACAMSLW